MDKQQFKDGLKRLFDYDERIDESIYMKHPEWESDVRSLESQWRFEAANLLMELAREAGMLS